MGAAKKPSGFAGRGCDERSCPSFLPGPDWGKCDEKPQGLVRAGPTGSRSSFFQAPRGTESVRDGGLPCNDSTVVRGNSSPPGFSFPLRAGSGWLLDAGLPRTRAAPLCHAATTQRLSGLPFWTNPPTASATASALAEPSRGPGAGQLFRQFQVARR